MMWTLRHQWPSRCRFVFNCYTHWAMLIVQSSSGADFVTTHLSREGVTQGCPLARNRRLKEELPIVHQPWYADDAAAASSLSKIHEVMNFLEKHGPSYGYFPEPSKSILVATPKNKAAAESAFADKGFIIVTGHRYLGGFIGNERCRPRQLAEQESVRLGTHCQRPGQRSHPIHPNCLHKSSEIPAERMAVFPKS
jgi:hypothetical protein